MTDATQESLKGLLEGLVLDAEYAAKALLQVQYLPNVKNDGEELPPLSSSETFTIDVAQALQSIKPTSAAWVEFRTRRFDGLVRRMGIPHPVPYAKLVLHMRDHWAALEKKLDSAQSQIKPEWHADGRLIQMDYVDHADEHLQYTRLAQGKHYLVKADISKCFPSIYSHALDWALRGKPVAKAWVAKPRKKRPPSWEATLDTFARNCVNTETKGLLIGPAVSNVLSELVLQRIDEALGSSPFVRYIDDYAAYFATREEAEDFVVTLQRELGSYRLDLNTRKTEIVSLREGVGDAWMADVLSHLPAEWTDLGAGRFLQQAELLAQRYPGVSVLKFAAKTLFGHAGCPEDGSLFLIDELVRITQFHPHLLPTLSREMDRYGDFSSNDVERLVGPLNQQLERAVRGAETDSVLWLLFIIRKQLGYERPARKKAVNKMIDLGPYPVWWTRGLAS